MHPLIIHQLATLEAARQLREAALRRHRRSAGRARPDRARRPRWTRGTGATAPTAAS
jgi:hypothetical protein